MSKHPYFTYFAHLSGATLRRYGGVIVYQLRVLPWRNKNDTSKYATLNRRRYRWSPAA